MGNDLIQWRSAIGVFNLRTQRLNIKMFYPWYPFDYIFNCSNYIFKRSKYCLNICTSFLVSIFLNIEFSSTVLLLVMLSGDVELNPGPLVSNNEQCSTRDSISLIHLNIRSIRNKFDYIKNEFLDYTVLCFTETHLSENISSDDLFLQGFTMYRKDKSPHSGGLLCYISNELVSSRRPDLESINIESLWIHVKFRGGSFLVCCTYRPPNTPVAFWDELNISTERALECNLNIVFLGDLNEDQLRNNNTKLKQFMTLNTLRNVITDPTRVTNNSSTLIDPIIISDNFNEIHSGVIDTPDYVSDHKATFLFSSLVYNHSKSIKRKVWLYKQADFDKLNDLILKEDWQFIINEDTNTATELFTNKLLNLMQQCIPFKEITIRKNDKPWYDSEIRKYSRKRDRQKTIALTINNEHQWVKYKQLRNKVNNLKKHAKEQFYNNIEETICDASNSEPKTYWKLLKHLVQNNKNSETIPPLINKTNLNETIYFSDDEKANFLNDFFASISTVDDTNATLPPVNLLTDNSLNDISLTEQEIIDTIQILNVNKAVGEDLISHKVLKNICHSISKPLCILYNKSLHTSIFPNIWKSAIVMPLFKKGDQNLVTNYRPISLLSCLGKLMERVVYKHLYNHLMAENLIYSKQSGFLSGHSTVYQLIDIFHQITQALDEKLYTCMVFCDISKAFDRVWHKGLVFKLKQNGINGSLLSWIDSYLNGRSQKVFLGSVMSNTRNVSAGVPQGSVLGPLFFLVYVNDIVDKLLSITRLFADDTSISSTSRNKDDIEGILNHDLNLISLWSKQWLVDFNPNKTEALFFTPHRFENNPNLLFDGVQVNFVDNHKHLGLSFSKDGKWHHHINSVITSASRVLGMLRKITFSV